MTDCVVVSANYRLGVLGWGYWTELGGEDWADSSNLGLQDQIAALAWVRRNIGALGGDPANVTVAGQSAGACSIGALLTMPSAEGLFDKAILSSGSTSRLVPPDVAARMAEHLADRVGAATMEQLQQVDAADLLAAQVEVIDSDLGARNLPGGRAWGVVLDGRVVRDDPQQALAAGAARHIPLLTAANVDEVRMFQLLLGAGFAPPDEQALLTEIERAGFSDAPAALANYTFRATQHATFADLRSAFLTDVIYRTPASETARLQVEAGGRAWSYVFNGRPLGALFGAFHGADLIYVFDQLGALGIDDARERTVRDDLTAAWRRFAWTGDPGWPQYSATGTTTRQFGGARWSYGRRAPHRSPDQRDGRKTAR